MLRFGATLQPGRLFWCELQICKPKVNNLFQIDTIFTLAWSFLMQSPTNLERQLGTQPDLIPGPEKGTSLEEEGSQYLRQ